MSKKLLSVGIVMVLVAAVLVGVPAAKAQTVSCANIDAMLTVLGITEAAKVAQAKLSFGCGAATAPAGAYTFTRDLTIGSTGADVTALQTLLGVTPATGYFGAITKAAVVAYQTSKGISATGYVGPLTRAALNYVAPVVVPPTTGGTTGGTTGLTGGAGDITVTSISTDVEDTVIEGETSNVLGFKIEASDSDVAIKSLKVTLTNDDAVSSYRLGDYADAVEVYMGSEKVGSIDASDFTKDGHVYSKSIALTDAVIKEGSSNKATFYVKVAAASNIDSGDLDTNNWDILVTNIRFTDAEGAIMTDSTEPHTNFAFSDLATSGDVTLVVSKGSSNPDAANVEVSDSGSTADVLMLEFKLKAKGSDLSFDQILVNLDGTIAGTPDLQDLLGELVLKNGSDELASVSTFAAADDESNVTFDLDDTFTVSDGDTETFRVYAKINDVDNFTAADSLKVSFANIAAEDQNGDVVSESGSAAGNVQTFQLNGAIVKYVTDGYSVENATDHIDGLITMKFTVEAFGDNDITIAEGQFLGGAKTTGVASQTAGAGLIVYTLTGGTTSDAIVSSSNITKDSDDNFIVSAGDTGTFTLSVKIAHGSTSGFVKLAISNVDQTSVTNVETANH